MQVVFNPIVSEPYWAGLSNDPAMIDAAQALRWRSFHPGMGEGRDYDDTDHYCAHLMIIDQRTQTLVGYTRVMVLRSDDSLAHSYSAQFYDLAPVMAQPGAALELGRFCLDANCHDPKVVKLIWAALLAISDANGVARMIGCSSFKGSDPLLHTAALTLLANGNVGTEGHRPNPRAPEIYTFAEELIGRPVDELQARRQIPPLLRSYLQMNGWVSDHAVVDHALDTIHVFTNVELAGVQPARLHGLRQLAARGQGAAPAGVALEGA
ncbi:putative acyl-CoA N-acyltransferase [Ketogulonicigenium vulgare Y25]|uniref:L-ornithine N(alpha)-acyltransferase n=2 Tax=Ketogulonicigenium vulgare TaxID=92945 RepID=F9Y5G6_KETVW|nr:putative acyl-CoA N-acyltransferase [Ketogulonicigenium vulgare Y25]AEM40719.1 Ornithine-acyl[acyl carrier protein] N-acyltransferase [Ketogulonicigenium vulgare WSH-001]ALJ80889.1 ornithine-acyl-ACP acyltransferase [Ketogulonicigenium vulgare]ANW33661.1 ornithine-acyl-ACP acyltransferase [Ketogulonicigenium vulgare]